MSGTRGMTMGDLIKQSKDKPVITMIKSPSMNDPHWVIVDGLELLDDGKEYVKVRDPETGDAWHVPFVDFGNLFSESSSQVISF